MIISTFDQLLLGKVEMKTVAPDGYHPAPPSFSFTRGDGIPLPISSEDEDKFNAQLIKGYDLLYPTPAAARESYEIAVPYLERISNSSSDPGINLGESDIASKFSIQRRLPPKYFLTQNKLPPGKFSEDFDMCLRAYIKKVAENSPFIGKNPIAIMLTDTDPFDTNQGFPTYSTDPSLRFTTASALSFKEYKATHIIEQIERMVLACGFPQDMIWPAAIAKRTGPTHKPVRVFRDHSDGYSAVSDTEATGYYTRARQVFMMPFYFNALISPVALALKYGRISLTGFGHDAAGEAKYLGFFNDNANFETAESDLSGFDTSITPALRKRVWHWCRYYGFNEVALDLLDAFEDTTMILSGPYNSRQKGSLSFVKGKFGLLSGLKVTTEVGSAISAASTLKALYRCNLLTKHQIEAGDWPLFLMLGDDILLRTARGSIKPDVFERSYAEEGLTVKYLAPGKRFLMNHVKNGKKYGVASRLIQQTLFNEDSYTHPGQLRLGLASRLSKEFFPEHWNALQSWAKDQAALVKLPELFTILAESSTAARASSELLNDPSVPAFLASAAGVAWVNALVQKNSISNKYSALMHVISKYSTAALETAAGQRKLLISALFNQDGKVAHSAMIRLNNHLNGVQSPQE